MVTEKQLSSTFYPLLLSTFMGNAVANEPWVHAAHFNGATHRGDLSYSRTAIRLYLQ